MQCNYKYFNYELKVYFLYTYLLNKLLFAEYFAESL